MPAGARPFPPVRACRVTVEGLYDLAPWANVFWLHLNGSGEISNVNLNQLCNWVYGGWTNTLLKVQSLESTIERVVALLYSDDGEQVAFSNPSSVPGLKGGTAMPASVSCCISWPIATHYKGGHPRTYLAAIPTSAQANSTSFDPDYSNAVGAEAEDFHTHLESMTELDGITSVSHGIYSFVRHKAWRDPPVFYRIMAGVHVDTRIDSQRRRLGRDRA